MTDKKDRELFEKTVGKIYYNDSVYEDMYIAWQAARAIDKAEIEKLREEVADANENFDAIRNILHDTQAMVAMQSEALKIAQAVMADNHAGLKVVDDALSATAETVAAWEAKKLEPLEKKLAWWEAPHDAELFAEMAKQASHKDSLAAQTVYIGHLERHIKELTKRETAARKQGFEEGKQAERNTAKIFTEQEAFNQGKQAGRDVLQNRVRELENALERASDYMPIETPLVRSGSTQEDIKLVHDALANTNPNSAEIQRLKVEIEVLQTLTVCPIQPSYVLAVIRLRRARLVELTKGE